MIFIVIISLALSACSTVSSSTNSAAISELSLQQVVSAIEAYHGQSVHWGGRILAVSNNEQYSEIQLVQLPLNALDQPLDGTESQGRFLIRSKQFLDPAIYQKDHLLTVTGSVQTVTDIKVDKKTLVLPVVQLNRAKVWQKTGHLRRPLPFKGLGYYGTGPNAF